MSLERVIACIKRNKRFLITSHTNLEGDALGSELAFYRLLKKLGKTATIINEDSLPYGYDFLPHKFNIKKFKENLKKQIRFDCLVVLDCSDLSRTGQVYKINTRAKPILNIDHHISNERFGDINWVEPDTSGCCEMIYKLYKKLNLSLDRKTALFLYAGILTDTGSFRYSNTTSFTHKVVAELLKYNLNVVEIYKNIYENIPFKDVKLLVRILPNIRLVEKGRIAWFQIKRNMLRNKKLSFDLTEALLGFARSIKDIEVAVLFKENLGVKDEIRVNLRSQGRIDVNKIAAYFGGGGHRTASAATVKGKIEQVRRKVLAKIQETLR